MPSVRCLAGSREAAGKRRAEDAVGPDEARGVNEARRERERSTEHGGTPQRHGAAEHRTDGTWSERRSARAGLEATPRAEAATPTP